MSTPNAEIQPMPPPPPPPPVANLEIETIVDGAETREDADANPYMPKKRKKTSPVWADFKEITLPNGQVKAECIHCKYQLSMNKSGSTTHLSRHIKNCVAKKISGAGQKKLAIKTTLSKAESVLSIQNFVYDQAKVREILSHMIIVHELPFNLAEYELFNLLMRTATPHYEKVSRTTTKNDSVTTFKLEKKKLMDELKCVNKISVTTDLWTSDQTVSYMVVTAHYVDSNWNLQKRTLNFCSVPPPHSGLMLCDVLHKCLVEWGIEKKVWTVTVDNAKNNDVAVRLLKENISYKHTLPLMGKIFHVRCCAHILNLLVQDGLSAIKDIIFKVRESVKYVTASEGRINLFNEIANQLQLSSKKLILDCCTRWNSTYFMLSSAIEFKDVFPRYQQRDATYKSLLSVEEWEKVRVVCTFLEDFNVATELISGTKLTSFSFIFSLYSTKLTNTSFIFYVGSEYPTANLFLPELVHIKLLLKEHEVVESEPIKSEVELIEGEGEVEPIEGVVEKDAAENESGTTYMQNMVKKMKKKFDKYWGSCNLLISMAAALDPRNKMKYIEWCADNVYSEVEGLELKVTVRETLRSLYDEYLEAYKAKFISDSADTQIACHGSSKSAATTKSKGRKMRSNYKTYMESVDNVDEIRSELDIYFEEGVVVWNDEEGAEFDAILWWKSNNLKFRILSKMACDVLSIPITTVASESAFSAGGRVIDPHRASLGVDTVQLLLCTEDWLRASYGIKRKAKVSIILLIYIYIYVHSPVYIIVSKVYIFIYCYRIKRASRRFI